MSDGDKFKKRLSEIGLNKVKIAAKEEFPDKYFAKCELDEKYETLLWMQEKVNGTEWILLFPRIDK